MAIKTVLIDDFDGTPLSGVSTTSFALNGARYEIDLAPENLEKLQEALAPFVKVARRVPARDELSENRASCRRRVAYHRPRSGRSPSRSR